ncbi:GNAT family N-acetyltransferase [Vibrio algarum]|uniref:GNAT family N-acetyltransferase n=1 Tax=Vibrio algarum TaxID=3020714 RepID=A0ABT4YYA6_9VIBR|nr:GNAT family N-acetyltransferase [Vibrio sp. KJ40-1]MDB1125953.1 GNAT family N-acetyltransferase [Vibrio sp. KJ40-1]
MKNAKVVLFNSDNRLHKQDLERLFVEYSDQVAPDIVDKLSTLAYFTGFILYIDNQPAGFAVCFDSFSTYRSQPVLNIHDFMIAKDFQGKKLGKVLLNAIEKYGRKQDVVKITLEVDDNNDVAKKLYASCGFEDHEVVLKGLMHWQKYLN